MSEVPALMFMTFLEVSINVVTLEWVVKKENIPLKMRIIWGEPHFRKHPYTVVQIEALGSLGMFAVNLLVSLFVKPKVINYPSQPNQSYLIPLEIWIYLDHDWMFLIVLGVGDPTHCISPNLFSISLLSACPFSKDSPGRSR